MQSVVMHLDMNSYFASVEQQDNLSWRGKPVGVCEHLGGIIIAASIEAKRWGIKTGTPVWEARKLYPKIILTKTHPDRYRLYIKRVIRIVSDYTGLVEQYSIDELFADLTKASNIKKVVSGERLVASDPFEEATDIGQIIKRRMKTEAADYLTCTIGIAENKLLAKIASDMQKPNGMVVVRSFHNVIPSDPPLSFGLESGGESRNPLALDFKRSLHSSAALVGRDGRIAKPPLILSKADLYHKLKLTDIPGIGHRQEKNLNKLGIKSLIDLKNYPKSLLVARFGINGHHLHQMGRLEGSWKPAVEQDLEIKSIGHMYTLPKEFREKKFFVPVLYKLCEMVARRLRKQGLTGNTIHFYLRDKDYNGFGESKKLGFYVYDGREIFFQCMRIFEKFTLPAGVFKLIGVTVAGLSPCSGQLSLFGDEEKQKRLIGALDAINSKYGDFTVARVPVLAAKDAFQDSVGFGRIKEV